MTMDTSASGSDSGALDAAQAGSLLADLLSPEPEKEESTAQAEQGSAEESKNPDETPDAPAEDAKEEEAPADEPQKVTIQVDGKTVELTQEQIAEAYKNGLRQDDYTRKTMQAAEQRKAAEAEAAKAREERQQYAQGLQQAQLLLQASLQEQSQIDWQKLLETDPVEYLKQQHLAQDRQAKLQRIQHEQQQIAAKNQQEAAEQMRTYIRTQQEELLAKLPEWKDESKAAAGKAELTKYLKAQGFDDDSIGRVSDHKAVLLAHKAMQYDAMMAKAQAAAKKVSNLPQKVERPGTGDAQTLDRRTAQYQKLGRTGRVEDAASLIANLL